MSRRLWRWTRQQASRILLLVLAAAACGPEILAAPPAADSLRPLGVSPGKTAELTVRGARLNEVTEWRSSLGVTAPVVAPQDGMDRPADRAQFSLQLPNDAPLGIHAWRVWGPGGASAQRLFVVDDLPTLPVDGGSTTLAAAREVAIPGAVDGRIGNLERHYFQFDLSAGQRLAVEVLARRLGSTLDPLLVLYGPNGAEVASADDVPGLGGDVQLLFQCESGGRYQLELRDVRYRGGDGAIYRLRLGDFPCVQGTLPTGIQRGATASVQFTGLEAAANLDVTVPQNWPYAWYAVPARSAAGGHAGFAAVRVTDRTEITESEPNDLPEQAQRIPSDGQVSGRFEAPGDVDRYRLTGQKGDRIAVTGMTRREGYPTDLVLRLLDAEGKQLARADDDGVEEGRLDQPLPADGDYVLEVTELLRRGGPGFVYRLDITPSVPGFSLNVDGDRWNVPIGGTAALAVSATRRNYAGEIELAVEGLPAGYTAAPARIGPGRNDAVLTITADAAAAPAPLAQVRVVGTATINGGPFRAVADDAVYLRAAWNSLPVVPLSARDQMVLAGTPAESLALQVDPVEVVFGRDLKGTVTVRAVRAEGYDDEIKLATLPEKGALPDQVSLELKPIAKGSSEVALTFSATEKAPLGPFSIVLVGTLKHDKETLTAPTPAINFRLAPPFTVEALAAEPMLPRNGSLKLQVKLQRNPAFAGAVKLTWKGLPAGVTAPETVLMPDQAEAEVELAASAEAAAGEAGDITLVATASENGKLTVETRLPKIRIE